MSYTINVAEEAAPPVVRAMTLTALQGVTSDMIKVPVYIEVVPTLKPAATANGCDTFTTFHVDNESRAPDVPMLLKAEPSRWPVTIGTAADTNLVPKLLEIGPLGMPTMSKSVALEVVVDTSAMS